MGECPPVVLVFVAESVTRPMVAGCDREVVRAGQDVTIYNNDLQQ